ncbi:hypothetical protein FACS18942_00010 [Planctomycetales bacterium]|nr:hypothetical protein FACS18942_00010 [Planctomycetales bacterium]GHT35114.1 hypothetical protein FACS189427_03710 [Planctomycetales bacterium]
MCLQTKKLFFLTSCVLCCILQCAVCAAEKQTTRNFEIAVEPSSAQTRPSAKETGVLVETLCAKLDKIFLQFSPQRLSDEKENQTESKQRNKKNSANPNDETAEQPQRVIPPCRIFIFNNRDSYETQCRSDGIEPPDEQYAGFFTLKNNSIYMLRSWSQQSTVETLLHETTHYYTFNFLPGGRHCYPQWFHEGLATSYENHIWFDNKLIIGVPPRIQKFDAPAAGLAELVNFRYFLRNKMPDIVPVKSKASKKAADEIPVIPEYIQMFTNEMEAKEKTLSEKTLNEAVRRRYAVYETFGRFLLFGKPKLLEQILRQSALWEKENYRGAKRSDWFVEAWKQAAADAPVTVEEIGRWLQNNQLPFKWAYGDWLDQGGQIAGKTDTGKIGILALKKSASFPSFTVFPKNISQFQVGVIFNFIDEKNYFVTAVNQDGNILLMQQRQGDWETNKIIGKVIPAADKRNPYPGSPAFRFQTVSQGNSVAIRINNVPVGIWQHLVGGTCGFFISSTEAVFTY